MSRGQWAGVSDTEALIRAQGAEVAIRVGEFGGGAPVVLADGDLDAFFCNSMAEVSISSTLNRSLTRDRPAASRWLAPDPPGSTIR